MCLRTGLSEYGYNCLQPGCIPGGFYPPGGDECYTICWGQSPVKGGYGIHPVRFVIVIMAELTTKLTVVIIRRNIE